MRKPAPVQIAIAAAVAAGLALRWAGRDYATWDMGEYLLPWYAHAREHGLASLGHAFTNYAPLFTYLLVAATAFDGLAAPLTLVKAISLPFELGCAVLAYAVARRLGSPQPRPALAFAAVFLAPSVLHNGAWWGQADAIWTCFLLASLLAFLSERPRWGMVAFAAAFSVKAQAAFFGPVVLGLLLRGALQWRWLAAVPAVYVVVALPAWLAGRPAGELANVYLGQAQTFSSLSKNAANPWLFASGLSYGTGTVLGCAAAFAAGLALAAALARARRLPPETLLLAAATALVLMPFILPKMHERYFYAFEIAVIVLAAVRPAFIPAAVGAQLTSALAYLPFDGGPALGLPLAAVVNGILLASLVAASAKAFRDGQLSADAGDASRRLMLLWSSVAVGLFLTWIVALLSLPDGSALWPANPKEPLGLALYVAALAGVGSLAMRRFSPRHPPTPMPEAAALTR